MQRLKNFKKESKDAAKAFEAPIGLSFVFDLFKGVKVNIRHIHIRYEDDIFSKEQTSFGLKIEEIDLSTVKSHWEFLSMTGMNFKRKPNNYVNKEFSIVNMSVYCESGCLIPTELVEKTLDEKYEIFSMLDSGAVCNFMNAEFFDDGDQEYHQKMGPQALEGSESRVDKTKLIEPFYVNVAINLNKLYTPLYKEEPFKYNVTTLISNVIFNVDPEVLSEIVNVIVFVQMFQYNSQMKKFRPRIRIQAFIDARERQGGKLTPEQDRKRKVIIRDTFRMVIWYVRLRKLAEKN